MTCNKDRYRYTLPTWKYLVSSHFIYFRMKEINRIGNTIEIATDAANIFQVFPYGKLKCVICINNDKVPYLRAERSLLVKVALHEVTIFSGCDFTPWRKNKLISKSIKQIK